MGQIHWCIDSISQKLNQSRGSPLTSQVLERRGMPDLRLIFSPGETWFASKPKSKRCRQPERLGAMPKYGSLKVKSMSSDFTGSIKFDLSIESCQLGHFEC